MSQPTPSLNPNRKSLRAPGRARLIKKQSSALSLRTPTPPTRFSTTPTATAAAPTITSTSKTHTSKRLSTHSLRSLVRKKSTPSLASNRIRGLSPSPSISAPAPQRELLRLSDILDPEELIREQRCLSGTPAPPGTPLSPNNPDGGNDDEFPTLLQATESGGEARRLIILSPSGARLDAEAFALRKDRPLTVGERQRRIREEMTRRVDDERRVGLERAMRKQGRMACCRVM
ncbi:MAG: hypothetical protein LQ339_000097 [Xanthoria mediterranea]|nr:MAG: hypothetical protein LQ339_000097 [Xanthoria mediterranea]